MGNVARRPAVSGRRAPQATKGRRKPGATARTSRSAASRGRRVSWPRRIGVALALVLLTASIALAGAALVPGGRTPPSENSRPPAAERHSQPASSLEAATEAPGGDDQPPPIRVGSPRDGQEVFRDRLTVTGRTEPAAEVVLRNVANGDEELVRVDESGLFSAELRLDAGDNVISLRATDPAGNRARATVEVRRSESRASVVLEASPPEIELAELPTSITVSAEIRGLRGEPVGGVPVVFSISVPGQPTATFTTTASAGRASWTGFRVPRGGAQPGEGLVTVMVVLQTPEGDEYRLQEGMSLRFR